MSSGCHSRLRACGQATHGLNQDSPPWVPYLQNGYYNNISQFTTFWENHWENGTCIILCSRIVWFITDVLASSWSLYCQIKALSIYYLIFKFILFISKKSSMRVTRVIKNKSALSFFPIHPQTVSYLIPLIKFLHCISVCFATCAHVWKTNWPHKCDILLCIPAAEIVIFMFATYITP